MTKQPLPSTTSPYKKGKKKTIEGEHPEEMETTVNLKKWRYSGDNQAKKPSAAEKEPYFASLDPPGNLHFPHRKWPHTALPLNNSSQKKPSKSFLATPIQTTFTSTQFERIPFSPTISSLLSPQLSPLSPSRLFSRSWTTLRPLSNA